MGNNFFTPKGNPIWSPDKNHIPKLKPQKSYNEERLSDYHVRRLYKLSFFQTLAALAVLSVAAAVVILPFLYMLSISFKPPAEIGNGYFFPQEIRKMTSGQTARITISLPPEQAIRIYSLDQIPILPLGATRFTPWPEPRYLPNGVTYATRLRQEKSNRTATNIQFTLEVPDPEGQLISMEKALVFIPSDKPDRWEQVESNVSKRTYLGVATNLMENYKKILRWDQLNSGQWVSWLAQGYPRWYFNSLFVAASTVFIGVFLDSLAAFGFAKFHFPFKKTLFGILIATLMIPYPVTLVPIFFVFAKLGFYNTYAALIVPGVVSAFGIFLVRQYMETIPNDMLDAARVDGANDLQVFREIVFPASLPILAALAVFRFIYQWNSYLFPLVLTNKDSMKTVQLGIATMEGMHGIADYGLQMAGSALAVIPIMIVYTFMQRHFIAGITIGTGKG